ncbi:hypothetical protein GCM10009839_05570 [Catenulispora yoronensis]|uniref:HTH cro/C1-type domain-containing protein n=1 Tax=Catenulispora yoronensis TaxID=450799 RepID=A0ABP5F5M2_9ACTN
MTAYPGFAVILQRVLEHRGADEDWLADSSGLAPAAVRAVLDGAVPDPEQLHVLAHALGYHVEDLFVLADIPVPVELTPLDPQASGPVNGLVERVDLLPPDQRRTIHALVAGLPQEPRPVPDGRVRPVPSVAEAGFSAALMTLLIHNRNLGSRVAYAMACMTHGRMYLARTTYRSMTDRPTQLKPDWILSIAAVVGIPAGDLSAMTGVPLPEEPLRGERRTAELRDLLWNCRRLTADQATQVRDTADAMFVPVPEDASKEEWRRYYRAADGVWWGAPRVPEDQD